MWQRHRLLVQKTQTGKTRPNSSPARSRRLRLPTMPFCACESYCKLEAHKAQLVPGMKNYTAHDKLVKYHPDAYSNDRAVEPGCQKRPKAKSGTLTRSSTA